MPITRGEPGYANAQVTVWLPANYYGAGIAGFEPLESFQFFTKLRESEFTRPRYDLSDGGAYKQGAGSSASRRVSMTLYYKGNIYPPDFEKYEFLLFQINFGGGQARFCVLMIETFRQVGDVDQALQYSVIGETDGIFA
jgi:hypothetical protein